MYLWLLSSLPPPPKILLSLTRAKKKDLGSTLKNREVCYKLLFTDFHWSTFSRLELILYCSYPYLINIQKNIFL